MRIDNLNITNKYISFTEQKIAFDKKGIYLISGENGSGKTTVIKQLIFGKNRISFNNREQEEAYINDRSGLFAYVPQNIIIPDITVGKYLNKENQIDAGSSLLLAERLGLSVDAKQKMKLLSGGEKEKLAIVAALQKNTPYIILDEPTASLDAVAEYEIYAGFEKLVENKTAIIISHRLSSTHFCDRIIVINNGTVFEDGTHQSLMAKESGIYKKMFTTQAAHYFSDPTTVAVD